MILLTYAAYSDVIHWREGASLSRCPMSIDESAGVGFATMRGRNYPAIRQFTIFLENQVGKLLEVIRRFEGSRVRIVALSISDTAECALVRLLVSHPEQGREILERAGLAIIESDLIGVEIPKGIRRCWRSAPPCCRPKSTSSRRIRCWSGRAATPPWP